MSISEKTRLISITGLADEIAQQREAVVIAMPLHEFEREVHGRWACMFTDGYVRQKILEAEANGRYSCTLAKEKIPLVLRDLVDLSHAYYDKIEPCDLSVKEKIESLIDSHEIRAIFRYEKEGKLEPTIKIMLFWGTLGMGLPRFFLAKPRAVKGLLFMLGFFLSLFAFIHALR